MTTSLNYNSECLRCGQIKKIADFISELYDIPYVDGVLFRREYESKTPMPLKVEKDDRAMWVDRYYVAYSLEDGVLHYVYNTRYHIIEEHKNWMEAARERNQPVWMPKDLLNIFYRSGYEMFLADHTCWVDKKFLKNLFKKAA